MYHELLCNVKSETDMIATVETGLQKIPSLRRQVPATRHFTNSTCTPATDCSTLAPRYEAFNDGRYKIQCEIDLPTASLGLISVWVSQFKDCVNACESFNLGVGFPHSSCKALSFDTSIERGNERLQFGNCFLKGSDAIVPFAQNGTRSAVLVKS